MACGNSMSLHPEDTIVLHLKAATTTTLHKNTWRRDSIQLSLHALHLAIISAHHAHIVSDNLILVNVGMRSKCHEQTKPKPSSTQFTPPSKRFPMAKWQAMDISPNWLELVWYFPFFLFSHRPYPLIHCQYSLSLQNIAEKYFTNQSYL